MPDETAGWLDKLGDKQSAKLAKVGLIPRRQNALLGPFLDDLIASRNDVKPATRIVFGHTRRCLIGYFGRCPLPDFSTSGCERIGHG
jgi:hypothetical protein